jgi:hypothetical protein
MDNPVLQELEKLPKNWYEKNGNETEDGINSYSRKRARWRIAGLSP